MLKMLGSKRDVNQLAKVTESGVTDMFSQGTMITC